MAKHGNPTVLRRYGLKETKDTLTLLHGPVAARGYYEGAQIALLRASHLLIMAASVFLKPHLLAMPKPRARILVVRFARSTRLLKETADAMPARDGAA
jgi:hypothetical protein